MIPVLCGYCAHLSVLHRVWCYSAVTGKDAPTLVSRNRDFLGSLSVSFIFQCYVLLTITLIPMVDRAVLSHKPWLGESSWAENKTMSVAFGCSSTIEHILNHSHRPRDSIQAQSTLASHQRQQVFQS